MIKTKRWNQPRKKSDGMRILVCRFRPRALKKEDETWDLWWKDLGPSAELHAAIYGKEGPPIAWEEFRSSGMPERFRDRVAVVIPAFNEEDNIGQVLPRIPAAVVERIAELVAAAEAQAGDQPAAIKERFARRMAELLGESAPEERILQEAAAQATRADVREELDRLTGHVAAARQLLAAEGAVGRRLDFLTQEFMREANTLCSKSASAALTSTGLDLKAVIDQFREQVQNVE